MANTGIHYLLVQNDHYAGEEQRFTFFHLLREVDTQSLRCLMALLHYPDDVGQILPNGRPFTEAIRRVRSCPRFRIVTKHRIPDALQTSMEASPLLFVMTGGVMPEWLSDVARLRPVAFLSATEHIAKDAASLEGVTSGSLQGMADVSVFYHLLRGLCAQASLDSRVDADTRAMCRTISQHDLLGARSRLRFIPPVPLPPAGKGRAPIYLLNRLSNNVDAPTLVFKEGDGETEWRVFRALLRGCGLLAALETGDDKVIKELGGNANELVTARSRLLSAESDDSKFRLLASLADGIGNQNWLARPMLTVPVPRSKLAKGEWPEGAWPDPGDLKPRLRALVDFISGAPKTSFQNTAEEKSYTRAIDTLWLEQRLLECQTAVVSSRAGLVPIQLSVTNDDVFHDLKELNKAFAANSPKASRLFRKVGDRLASHLPEWVLDVVRHGESTIQFLSDVPMEWAQVEGWPISLTRPVSRLPIGAAPWDVVVAAMETGAVIDATAPERVLVLDLVKRDDPIRRYSDYFAFASNAGGQRYTYATPESGEQFRKIVEDIAPDIVVLDSHGRYNPLADQLWIDLGGGEVLIDELVPRTQVPPVWILSACDTSVTGAVRGCMVRRLLAMGALCVVATLAPVDAFAASMFVGRLLTDVYSPVVKGGYENFGDVFFSTQVTTALLYDSLFPLMRRAETQSSLKPSIGGVIGDYLRWTHHRPIADVREFRVEAACALGIFLDRHGLAATMKDLERAGRTRPETLLFSAFGIPAAVEISFTGCGPRCS